MTGIASTISQDWQTHRPPPTPAEYMRYLFLYRLPQSAQGAARRRNQELARLFGFVGLPDPAWSACSRRVMALRAMRDASNWASNCWARAIAAATGGGVEERSKYAQIVLVVAEMKRGRSSGTCTTSGSTRTTSRSSRNSRARSPFFQERLQRRQLKAGLSALPTEQRRSLLRMGQRTAGPGQPHTSTRPHR